MKTRIYLITDRVNVTQHLVRAANGAQAIRHLTRARYGAAVATQEKLVELLAAGKKIEDASAEPETESEPVN